jgi:hypothetical protein
MPAGNSPLLWVSQQDPSSEPGLGDWQPTLGMEEPIQEVPEVIYVPWRDFQVPLGAGILGHSFSL